MRQPDSALINEDAEIGVNGNTNTANLQYSDNPNVDSIGDTTNPDKPAPSDPTGKTPVDTVITYLTEIKLEKVDADTDETLAGAKFKIEGISSKVKVINSEMFVAYGEGDVEVEGNVWYRLKDGNYTQDEATPDNPETEAIEGTAHGYESTTVKYKKVTEVTKDTVTEDFVAEGWVKSDGTLTFTGLGEGTYTITELVAPEGYNLLKTPITVVVKSNVATITNPIATTTVTWTADKDGSADTTSDAYTVTDEGKIEITVENTSGAELPSTGGIGTTIFYISGAVLLLGAAVLLITKRRMNAGE